jgi:hypothetical protein
VKTVEDVSFRRLMRIRGDPEEQRVTPSAFVPTIRKPFKWTYAGKLLHA